MPWIAAESKFGFELGLKWIDSKKEHIASAGWSTLANYAAIIPDAELDIKVYGKLLDRVTRDLPEAQNRVRYTMNGFVIAVGSYIGELSDQAMQVGRQIGKVQVDMGGTACKVPLAAEYIQKVITRGNLGKKRKLARC